MTGHHHITQNNQSVAQSDLFQNSEKQIAPGGRAQLRLAVLATARNEVQVARTIVSLVSLEILGHDGNARTKANLASVTNDL